MTTLVLIQAAQLALLALVAVYCVREWRSATHYRDDQMAVQMDRLRAEYVALKRSRRGAGRVVAPVGASGQQNGHEREQDPVLEFERLGHGLRVPMESDA